MDLLDKLKQSRSMTNLLLPLLVLSIENGLRVWESQTSCTRIVERSSSRHYSQSYALRLV